MTRSFACIAILLVLVSGPGLERPAAAQPAAAPPPLTVELAPEPFPLGEVAVRAAIGTELGVPTREAAAHIEEAGGLGIIRVSLEGARRAVVSYRPHAGDAAGTIARTIDLPPRPEDALQLIALIAGNMVRDQAGPLIAELSLQIEIDDPSATPDGAPRAAAPAAAAAPLASAAPELPAPLAVASAPPGPERRILFTLGFLPPIATDRLWPVGPGEEVVVTGGVHLLVGMTDGVRGVSLSGVADVQRRFTHGLQVGGVATVTAGELDGVQVAGALAVAGRVHGAQLAGSAALARTVDDGAQIAGAIAAASSVTGAQLAGAAAVAGKLQGVQIAGGAAIAGDLTGLQLAPINVARRVRGLQLGVINISDDMDGVPIGVISIVRHGRLEFDGWVESSRIGAIALRHGPRRFHNIYGVAYDLSAADSNANPFVGLGFGTHWPMAHGALDVDAMAWDTDVGSGDLGLLNQLRATVAIDAGPVALLVGAAANVHVRDTTDTLDLHPVLERTYQSGDVDVTIWPTLFAGVRLR